MFYSENPSDLFNCVLFFIIKEIVPGKPLTLCHYLPEFLKLLIHFHILELVLYLFQGYGGMKHEIAVEEAFDALEGLDDIAFEPVWMLANGDSSW